MTIRLIIGLTMATLTGLAVFPTDYMEMVMRSPNATEARRRLGVTNGVGGLVQTNISYVAVTNAPWRLSRWTTNQDNVTINGATLTNAVVLRAGQNITITTNSGRDYTIASSNVIVEIAAGAVETPFITDGGEQYTSNIVMSVTAPLTGLYTLHALCMTMPRSNTIATQLPIDSSAALYASWTDPSGTPMETTLFAVATWLHYGFNGLPSATDAQIKAMTIACKAGTSVVVSNYTTASFSAGADNESTNHCRAALWGRSQ